MQLFLSLADSDKEAPNENYARELMELFTLGRGYSERDIRQAARALTGFRANWSRNGDCGGITYYDGQPRPGHQADLPQERALRLARRAPPRDRAPDHAPFLVGKLWDYFVTEPLDRGTRARLARTYRHSGQRIKPVVERDPRPPDALRGPRRSPAMVKCPVVFVAGALRSTHRYVDDDSWAWLLDEHGPVPVPAAVGGRLGLGPRVAVHQHRARALQRGELPGADRAR